MPFDAGMPDTPLERLVEASLKPTPERRATKKRQRRPPLTTREKQKQRRETIARDSVVIIDRLEKILRDGENWIQGDLTDHAGGFCLIGAIKQARWELLVAPTDVAPMYLRHAIFKVTGVDRSVIDFNDSRESYAEIREVIHQARKQAQAVADGLA